MERVIKKRLSEKKAIEYIKNEAKKRSCNVKIYTSEKARTTIFKHYDGEFCSQNMEIKCFRNKKDKNANWIAVLVHEYYHLLQSQQQRGNWDNFMRNACKIIDLDDILKNKKRISKSKRFQVAKSIIKLELECEINTINFLKNVNCNIDIENYIASANIILYKYIYWAITGRWKNFKKSEEDFKDLVAALVKSNKINTFKKRNTYTSMKLPKRILLFLQQNFK